MHVQILRLAGGSYALMRDGHRDQQTLLQPGVTPSESLRQSAARMREEAARVIQRAELIERGAECLAAKGN